MSPEKLIIFDYSGTLSRDAALFSRPNDLMKHFEESGLMDMGIDNPAMFWEKIVNPTWNEGSTTSTGYKKVMEDRLRNTLYQKMSIVSCVRISNAVSSFVDRYFEHSRIDRRWEPTLRRLHENPFIRTVIATDHYAEATGHIIKFLHELKIQATAARDAFANPQKVSFVVANSADIGVHKADPRFWKIINSGLNMANIHSILIVDDFGSNEQKGDTYGERNNVEARRKKTVRMLESEFKSEVQVIPFMIEGGDLSQDEIYETLITGAIAIIERYLASAG